MSKTAHHWVKQLQANSKPAYLLIADLIAEDVRLGRLSARFDNAEITGALGKFEAPERVKIIDAPVDPSAPTTPGRLLFVLAGLLGGLFMGIGLTVLAEIFDPRLRRLVDFEKAAGIPVLARYRA